MDFTGRLNFTYPQMAEKDSPESKTFDFSRVNRPTMIRDARSVFGLEAEASDATEFLTDGIGFLLVKSESKVVDWRNAEEVSAKHYPECKSMAEALLPEAKILAIESHTFRDEDKKEHYFVDGI